MITIKKLKKETTVILVSVICLTVMTLGFSYAVFFDIDTSTSNQNIETGTLVVEFGSSTSSIVNNNMLPTPDAVALESESMSTIYLQNNGSLDSDFVITLGYDYEAFNAASSPESNLIPLEFLNTAIFEYNPSTGESVIVSDIVSLADLVPNDLNSETYNLYQSVIGKSSSGSNAKTYIVRIWLDEFAPEYLSNYKLYLKLGVSAQATEATTNYTVKGVLKENSTNLANANISIQNGYIKTTTDASGNFTLSGLKQGNYNIKIISSSGDTFTGTFSLKESDIESLSKYVGTHQITYGNNIENVAYTYTTSINNLKQVNLMMKNSKDTELIEDQSIIIPNVYQINGGPDSEISGLTITVGNELISSMTKS